MSERLYHEFGPLCAPDSEILILGSFPSVRSREQQFYYAHPQNRFWKVMASLCGSDVPQTVADKKEMLIKNHIALWDVIESCEITGSSDSSIRNVRVNDLGVILSQAHIRLIAANGSTAGSLYRKYDEPLLNTPAVRLPSTSPANAAWSTDRLIKTWGEALHLSR
jgi:TDG/mug DNA glycosylase family protein